MIQVEIWALIAIRRALLERTDRSSHSKNLNEADRCLLRSYSLLIKKLPGLIVVVSEQEAAWVDRFYYSSRPAVISLCCCPALTRQSDRCSNACNCLLPLQTSITYQGDPFYLPWTGHVVVPGYALCACAVYRGLRLTSVLACSVCRRVCRTYL